MHQNMYDLTNPQKSIWYTEEFYKGTPINNISGTVIIPKKVNFKLLKQAINIFVEKNDSFRLKFALNGNKVHQFVENYKEFDIETIFLESDKDLKRLEESASSLIFNVFNSFLFKFQILKFKDGHGGFIITMHHLISDAWSAGIGASSIIDIYSRLLNNENLDSLSYPSYIDYINSEKDYIKSLKYAIDKDFWNKLYEKVPEIAKIPGTYKNDFENNLSANRLRYIVPKGILDKSQDYCKKNNISLFNFFMALFAIYIGRVSSLEEFVIGTPILNRSNIKEKHTSRYVY